MGSEFPHRRRRVRVILRRASALLVAVALGALAWLAAGNGQRSAPAVADHSGAQHLVQGVRTSIYDENGLQLRVSADSVAVRSPRLVGPLRIGFLRAIFARNVLVESFDPAPDAAAAAGSVPVSDALAELLPQPARRGITSAEIDSLHFVHHQGDQVALRVEADHCESASRPMRLVCRNGRLQEGAQERRFREAAFDGKHWSVEQAAVNRAIPAADER